MNKLSYITSFKDLKMEKDSTKFKILITEKQIELKTLELKNHLEPIKLIGSVVNKLLESFLKK